MLVPQGRRVLEIIVLVATLGCAACSSDLFTVAMEAAPSDASSPSDASDASDASSDAFEGPDAPVPRRDASLADGDVSGGSARDGGPGTNANLLECGSAGCEIGGGKQACCVTSTFGSGSYDFACVADAKTCNDPPTGSSQVFMRCGSKTFCSGECCLRRDQFGHFTTFCNATCPVKLCALGGPASACNLDEPCVRPISPAFDMLPGGYGSCGRKLP